MATLVKNMNTLKRLARLGYINLCDDTGKKMGIPYSHIAFLVGLFKIAGLIGLAVCYYRLLLPCNFFFVHHCLERN